MTNGEFLHWLEDRLVNLYHESENVDFVRRLHDIAIACSTAEMLGLDNQVGVWRYCPSGTNEKEICDATECMSLGKWSRYYTLEGVRCEQVLCHEHRENTDLLK